MKRPSDAELQELKEFAEQGTMRFERRVALARLLEAYEVMERSFEENLRASSMMAAELQRLRSSFTILQDELSRVRQYVEVQEAILNEARADLREAQDSLGSLGV